MKQYFLSAAMALLLTGFAAQAQENADAEPNEKNDAKNNKKLKEYDEIVIKRKDLKKNAKVTIEIKDDEVIVDGKPIEEFSDDEISVQKRSKNRFRLNSPSSQFRFEGGDWEMDLQDHLEKNENRAFLGVTTEGTSGGTRIVRVSENSGAAKAGLKTGDVITKINDKPVFDHEQLSDALASLKPNDKVNITYKRDGKENKIAATLGKRSAALSYGPNHPIPPMPPMVFDFDNGDDMGDNFRHQLFKPRLGIKVQDTEDGKGVKVLDVDEESPAEKAGIKENDIITSFDGKEMNSATDLAKASREAKEKSSFKVQLNRDGKTQTIDVKIPKKLKTANL